MRELLVFTFQSKCSRYRRLLSSEFLRRFLLPSWLKRKTQSKERSNTYSASIWWEYVLRYKRYAVILLCLIRSGSSSGKEGGRLPPSLSLPPASDDVLWDCDCWDWGWTGWDWWICGEGWLWLCCFLSLFWWASSPFWEGVDTSWVFFTLKNTGEGGLFSMGLNSQTEGGQFWEVSIMTLLTPLCGSVWVGIWALNPSHLFLELDLTGVFWSLGCSSLGSILTLSGWFHSLCFCRRTFVANTASQ